MPERSLKKGEKIFFSSGCFNQLKLGVKAFILVRLPLFLGGTESANDDREFDFTGAGLPRSGSRSVTLAFSTLARNGIICAGMTERETSQLAIMLRLMGTPSCSQWRANADWDLNDRRRSPRSRRPRSSISGIIFLWQFFFLIGRSGCFSQPWKCSSRSHSQLHRPVLEPDFS